MKRRLQAFVYLLTEGNLKVFGTVFITGLFVTLARVLAPMQIAHDQGLQLEAAHRLVQGLGLTFSSTLNYDLNQPPGSEYLTHFPPALSLLVASFLFLRIPLVIALKLIYSLTTVLGWFFWAAIGSRLLSKPLRLGKFSLSVQYVIAIILPIFYTPAWSTQGTDIFLWAGVPIIVFLLFYSSSENSASESLRNSLLILAGLLSGLLFSFRYNSIFLSIAAFLILLQVNLLKFVRLSKNYAIFLISSCFFIIPVFIYNKTVLSNNVLPAQATQSRGLSLIEGINEIFRTLSMTSVLSGFIPTGFVDFIQSHTLINYIYGFACFLLLLFLPWIVVFYKKLSVAAIRKDIAVAVSLLPISLVLYFIAALFPVSFSPINIPRYYLPINFCLILIVYHLASLPNESISLYSTEHQQSTIRHKADLPVPRSSHPIKTLAYLFICLFLVFNLLYRPASFVSKKFTNFTELFLGIIAVPKFDYPDNKIVTEYDNSLLVLKALEKEGTNTLFFVQAAPVFTYNNPLNYRRIPDKQFWQKAFLSKATKIVWVINNPSCPRICAPQDMSKNPASLDLDLPNLNLVFVDSFNGTKIMVSDLPAGYKFSQ